MNFLQKSPRRTGQGSHPPRRQERQDHQDTVRFSSARHCALPSLSPSLFSSRPVGRSFAQPYLSEVSDTSSTILGNGRCTKVGTGEVPVPTRLQGSIRDRGVTLRSASESAEYAGGRGVEGPRHLLAEAQDARLHRVAFADPIYHTGSR